MEMLEVSLLGVGTVLRLGRDAWSTVKRLRQATNEYAPSPPARPPKDSTAAVSLSYHHTIPLCLLTAVPRRPTQPPHVHLLTSPRTRAVARRTRSCREHAGTTNRPREGSYYCCTYQAPGTRYDMPALLQQLGIKY